MPFITEELWARTSETPRETLLIEADWPEVVTLPDADAAIAEMNWVMEFIKGVRSVRAEMNVPAGAKIPMRADRRVGRGTGTAFGNIRASS